MKIERVQKKDLPELNKIIKKEFPYTNSDLNKVEKRFNFENIFLFKLVEEKNLVGFIEIELKENLAIINGLAVKANFRRKGFATKLAQFAIQFCKEKKLDGIKLIVKHSNAAAKNLYKKLGFRFNRPLEKTIDGSRIEEFFLDLTEKKEFTPNVI